MVNLSKATLKGADLPFESTEKGKGSMTKKHFKAIAQSMKQSHNDYCFDFNDIGLYWRICENLADTLSQFNDKFDKDKFFEACGV